MTDSPHVAYIPRPLKILGILTVVGVFAVNAMGFVDHDTHSGQGCGAQWPLCQGTVIPPFTHEAVVIEWTHRVLSLGFFLVLTAFLLGLRKHYQGQPTVMRPVVTVIVLLVAETMLCTLSVLWTLPTALLGLLAVGGLVVQTLLARLTLGLGNPGSQDQMPSIWSRTALGMLLLYLYAGACASYRTLPIEWLTTGVHILGIFMAITGAVWIAGARSAGERRTAWMFAIPALLGAALVHLNRLTVLGDLGVVLWLSWLLAAALKGCLPPLVNRASRPALRIPTGASRTTAPLSKTR